MSVNTIIIDGTVVEAPWSGNGKAGPIASVKIQNVETWQGGRSSVTYKAIGNRDAAVAMSRLEIGQTVTVIGKLSERIHNKDGKTYNFIEVWAQKVIADGLAKAQGAPDLTSPVSSEDRW